MSRNAQRNARHCSAFQRDARHFTLPFLAVSPRSKAASASPVRTVCRRLPRFEPEPAATPLGGGQPAAAAAELAAGAAGAEGATGSEELERFRSDDSFVVVEAEPCGLLPFLDLSTAFSLPCFHCLFTAFPLTFHRLSFTFHFPFHCRALIFPLPFVDLSLPVGTARRRSRRSSGSRQGW